MNRYPPDRIKYAITITPRIGMLYKYSVNVYAYYGNPNLPNHRDTTINNTTMLAITEKSARRLANSIVDGWKKRYEREYEQFKKTLAGTITYEL